MPTVEQPTTGGTAESEPRPNVCADSPQLIDAKTAARRCGVAVRTWLRLCDAGKAPWGVKLGGCRRWRVAELDGWLSAGCPSVRSAKGGSR